MRRSHGGSTFETPLVRSSLLDSHRLYSRRVAECFTASSSVVRLSLQPATCLPAIIIVAASTISDSFPRAPSSCRFPWKTISEHYPFALEPLSTVRVNTKYACSTRKLTVKVYQSAIWRTLDLLQFDLSGPWTGHCPQTYKQRDFSSMESFALYESIFLVFFLQNKK